MQLGLSSYTYGWAVSAGLTEFELLERTHQFGLGLLQIADNTGFASRPITYLAEVAAEAQRLQIRLELGAKRLTVENVRTHIALCHQLDAKFLRFVADDTDYHPTPQEVESVLKTVESELQEITLGLENHDRFGAKTLQSIIENVGSAHVGICLDTANSLGAGEGINEVLQILAPLTVNLHIKDFCVRRVPYLMGLEVQGAPAGSGFLNVPALIEILESSGRCNSAILELWTPPVKEEEKQLEATISKEAEWASQSVDYLKSLMATP